MGYGNTVKDGSGVFYHQLLDDQGRLIFHDGWDPLLIEDTDANDSDKIFTVPANKIYRLQTARITLVSTSTVGSRQIVVEFGDGSNVIFAMRAGTTQAASLTRYYNYGVGIQELTSFRDTDHLQCSLPDNLQLPAGYTIRIYDNKAIAAAADDMTIRMMVYQKDT